MIQPMFIWGRVRKGKTLDQDSPECMSNQCVPGHDSVEVLITNQKTPKRNRAKHRIIQFLNFRRPFKKDEQDLAKRSKDLIAGRCYAFQAVGDRKQRFVHFQ